MIRPFPHRRPIVRRLAPVGLAILLATGCGRIGPRASAPHAGDPPTAAELPIRLVDVREPAGIDYRWEIAGKRPLTILQTIGNGVGLLDYDGDGNPDLLCVGRRVALYRGDGTGRFIDVSRGAGVASLRGRFLGCATGDFDNDGDPDVYLSAYRGGALLRNDDGRFIDITRAAGIAPQPWGSACSFADIDSDGRLDLYIGNYVVFGPNVKPQLCDFHGLLSSCGPRYYQPERGVLYRNLGDGRFRDVTRAWGADRVSGKALGVAIADFDGSGRQSIAIANDEVPGDLLLNLGKRFRNIGVASNTAYDAEGNPHAGMGIDWGDFDLDGDLDLVVTTFVHEAKSVYRQEEPRFFTDVAAQLGLNEHTLPYVGFGVRWADFDNDRWPDLLIANGHVQDNVAQIDPAQSYRQPTQLFRNREGSGFDYLTPAHGEPLTRPIVGRGVATGDLDNDGRIDAVVVDSEGMPLVLMNRSPRVGRWLSLRLIGTRSNRDGIGARVIVTANGRSQALRCATDGSYFSASDVRVHCGLGAAETATVTIHWPSGSRSELREVPSNRFLVVREGASEFVATPPPGAGAGR